MTFFCSIFFAERCLMMALLVSPTIPCFSRKLHNMKLIPRSGRFRTIGRISYKRQNFEPLRSKNTGGSEKKRYCVLDASCFLGLWHQLVLFLSRRQWGCRTQHFQMSWEFLQCGSSFLRSLCGPVCIVKSRGKTSSFYMNRSMRRLWICHCDGLPPRFATCNRKRVA